MDIDQTIASLSTSQKVRLLGGSSFFKLGCVPEAGIPALAISDGPNGVRGPQVWNQLPSAALPCGPGLAASFDQGFIQQAGDLVGRECRSKNTHILAGPTTNIPRSPLGGRNFESYSEDPLLNGLVGAAFINGVQGQKVAVCAKHFVANDQEFERWSIDAVISLRALREIYLEPFRLVQKFSKPRSIMSCYNRVNGCHVSEDAYLLGSILREEWGFEGCVISDWTGVYSTLKSLKAGCDIEMPGPPVMRGATTLRLLHAGKITPADIDDRMKPILGLIKFGQDSGIPFEGRGSHLPESETRNLLTEAAARAVVVLKNDVQLLPLQLSDVKRIAVIGRPSKYPVNGGGGSSELAHLFKASLVDAIEAAHPAKVQYVDGVHTYRAVPLADPYCAHVDGMATVEFWRNNPVGDWWNERVIPTACDWKTSTGTMNGFMVDGLPRDILGNNPRIRITTTFHPSQAGKWSLSLCSVGTARLYLDGVCLLDNTTDYSRGEMFVGLGSKEIRKLVTLDAGRAYDLEVRIFNDITHRNAPPPEIPGGFRVGAMLVKTESELRDEAVLAASNADVAIVMVGYNEDWEAEGFDRQSMALPPGCDELVTAVLQANPRTIVVTQSGCAIELPWVDKAHTLVHAFYGGSASGQGIWDVLTGTTEPGSVLPITFPKRLEDNPSAHSFGVTSKIPGKVLYDEGIFIGYRHYCRHNVAVNFAFGHGLSYTSFRLTTLGVTPVGSGSYEVHCSIVNTGTRPGRRVVQFYIATDDRTVERAPMELCSFVATSLAPGQETKVQVVVDKKAFSYWSEEEDCWVAQPGQYTISAGFSSVDLVQSVSIQLDNRLQWKGI